MRKGNQNLNIADYVSISRIILFPAMVLFIFLNEKLTFAILLSISFFSDWLDGFIARRLKIVTKKGAYLDSIGDVLMLVGALIGFVRFEFNFVKEQLLLIGISLFLYIFQLALAYWRYGKPSSFHTYSAKTSAVILGAFFLTSFFFEPHLWIFYLAFIVALIEEFEEIAIIFIMPKWKTDIKGLYWVMKKSN